VNELALFAGAGGGILGGHLLGWRTVCAVEWEPYAACVLAQRQNDGLLPAFPIWDDVRTFDGHPWRGCVDVVSGGFPCQDISVAGKGAGIDGERSGMWAHMARVVGEVRPRFVFVENSPALVTRGLGRVLGDLAALGYDSRWTVLGAADVGAAHQRDRLWLVAHANGVRELQPQRRERDEWGRLGDGGCEVSDAGRPDVEGQRPESWGIGAELSDIGKPGWWASEPDVGRMADGVAARVDRLKAIGNGQVPLCAATAFRELAATFG
jgi:DNA (cytosine-5)-methyltransferase 1